MHAVEVGPHRRFRQQRRHRLDRRAIELSEDEWDQVFDVNVKSFFLTAKHVIPVMEKKGKGAIVNVSSIASIRSPKGVAYFAYNGARRGEFADARDRLAVRRQGHPLQRHPARPDAHADDRLLAEQYAKGEKDHNQAYDKMIAIRNRASPTGRWAPAGTRQRRAVPRLRRGSLRQRPPAGVRRRHHRPRVSTKREMNGLVRMIRNRRKRL